MIQTIRTIAVAVALLGTTVQAFAQGQPAPVAPAQAVQTYEGTEGNENYLKFVLKDGKAVMHDAFTSNPVNGTYQSDGEKLTITFANCVYEGSRNGNVISGVARFTEGPHAGTTWMFRVEVR